MSSPISGALLALCPERRRACRAPILQKGTITMRVILTSIVALVTMSALTFAQNITYDFNRSVDFAWFHTFAWIPGAAPVDELNDQRIVAAVSAQLQSKGLRAVATTAQPDLLVAYHATFASDLEITGFSSGWGPYRLGPARSGTVRADEILTGTLAVDIIDARTRTIVWRGTASKEIDVKADPSKRTRNITRACERLFRNYPPAR
jgi:hypothetical protein